MFVKENCTFFAVFESTFFNFSTISFKFVLIFCFCFLKDLKDYFRAAGEITYTNAHKPRQGEG